MVEESGVVELFGLVLSGVVVDDGFAVLFGFAEFISVLLELGVVEVDEELLDGAVVSVVLLVDDEGDVEFMSELLLGEVVLDGEVEVLDPVWLDDVDGVLWASVLLEVLLLCAMAIPVEKMTAVAIVRSFLLMLRFLLSAG